MSTLLSLDLTSALRIAVEQSMPQMRGNALLNSLQVADKVNNSNSFVAPSSNTETTTQKDKLKTADSDIFSILSGGFAASDAEMANFDLAYTSQATMVSGSEMGQRSTFLILA